MVKRTHGGHALAPLSYLCGPLPFLQAVRSRLIGHGVTPYDIQYEVFGPDLWQADTDWSWTVQTAWVLLPRRRDGACSSGCLRM